MTTDPTSIQIRARYAQLRRMSKPELAKKVMGRLQSSSAEKAPKDDLVCQVLHNEWSHKSIAIAFA